MPLQLAAQKVRNDGHPLQVARQAAEFLLGEFGMAVQRNAGAKSANDGAMRGQEVNLRPDWIHSVLLLLSSTLGGLCYSAVTNR